MRLHEAEVMDNRSLTTDDTAHGAERPRRVALGQAKYGGCIADLAGVHSLGTEACKACASLVEHPESSFHRNAPASYLPGQRVLAHHEGQNPFGSAELLQCRAQRVATHVR